MPQLNRLAARAPGSPTMLAATGGTRHPDPISLAVGEPAEAPPGEVVEAAVAAARASRGRYGPAGGLPALRERLAAEHVARTGVPTGTDSVLVTIGGKQALYLALRCVVEPGDEVLVSAPCWPSFPSQVEWCGARAVVVESDEELLPDPERLAAACTARTRAVIVNSPANPTGRALPTERLLAIARLVQDRDLWLVSDEVYRDSSLDGAPPEPLSVAPELTPRAVVVDSFSKRFAMTGYRLGYAVAPPPLIAAMTRLVASSTTHPCSISQHAGLAALALDGRWEAEQRARYRRRRDRLLARLAAVPDLRCVVPDAALFAFPDVRGWLAHDGRGSDGDLARGLREEAGVLVVPGSAFGAPGHLRVGTGVEDERLEQALDRLVAHLAAPSPP